MGRHLCSLLTKSSIVAIVDVPGGFALLGQTSGDDAEELGETKNLFSPRLRLCPHLFSAAFLACQDAQDLEDASIFHLDV